MGEPSHEDIFLFESLTTLPTAEAIKWLKAHNNNVNNAANAYWDNPNSQPTPPYTDNKWDENSFHSDKMDIGQQGQSRSSENPWEDMEAFTIHSQDTLTPNVFVDSAPSRPPSRVSTRGAHPSTDLAVGSQRPLNLEEQQMEQALAASMGQNIPGQTSGVIDGQYPYFGPARRDDYDSNWTMATTGSRTKEIMLNPEPIERKRGSNMPAFLKPTPQAYRLAALIKILQTIPMSREALLCREHLKTDYGYDAEWWDGTAIKFPKVFDLSQEGYLTDQEETIFEIQRLVAFLEETDRAYGSIDVLASMETLNGKGNSTTIGAFLDQWREVVENYTPNHSLTDVFKSVGKRENPDDPHSAEEYPFVALEVRIDEGIADKGQTLYEAIDDVLWADQGQSGSYEQVYLEKTADVLILELTRVTEAGSGLGIKIPSIWFSDRYLHSSNKQVQDMQAGKAVVREQIARIDEAKAKMVEIKVPAIKTTQTDASHLLKTATEHFEKLALISDIDESSEVSEGGSSLQDRSRYRRIAEELKVLTERISQKLKAFETSKERAREKLDEFSKLYTKASSDPDTPPYHKYTLRGVCGLPHTMYVLEKTQPDDENDILSSEPKNWQWWKISYTGTDSKPVSRIKVREIEVLKAAKDESKSTLLVYASEKAVSYNFGELPSQLRNFVRADNLSFEAELEKPASYPKPTTPTKRKADDIDGDELSSKFYRSSPQKNEKDFTQSNDLVDPALPSYISSWPSPPFSPSRPNQPLPHNLRNPDTYDERIPFTLRDTGAMLDPTTMMLDQDDGGSETGQEMLDRGGRLSSHTGGDSMNKGQALQTYIPEVTMKDKEDEDVPRIKHVGFAG